MTASGSEAWVCPSQNRLSSLEHPSSADHLELASRLRCLRFCSEHTHTSQPHRLSVRGPGAASAGGSRRERTRRTENTN